MQRNCHRYEKDLFFQCVPHCIKIYIWGRKVLLSVFKNLATISIKKSKMKNFAQLVSRWRVGSTKTLHANSSIINVRARRYHAVWQRTQYITGGEAARHIVSLFPPSQEIAKYDLSLLGPSGQRGFTRHNIYSACLLVVYIQITLKSNCIILSINKLRKSYNSKACC